ncbi:MAG: C-GCAxxG-C-C family protein [Candidatus Thermoplasmatota archaeon]
MKDEDIIHEVYQKAYEYEAKLGSCPQCVIAALKETIGVGNEDVFKSADALAGGTSLSSRGTCGALVGGMLAISSLVGREYKEFQEGKKKRLVFKYSKPLYERFIEEYGSPLCCDVQKKLFGRSYVLYDKEEYEAFERAGAHVDKCPSVAGNVARWTAEIILREIKPIKKEE